MADTANMIKVLREFPKMVEASQKIGDDITIPKEFVENIIVIGMGGSGYNGDLLKTYLHDHPIQIHVVKDYTLPKFVNRKSLVFAMSYSGNTEETIAAYRLAIRRGCKIVSVSAGGKLQELAKMNKNSHVEIPSGIQPRLSTPFQFIAMLNILSLSGVIDEQEKKIKKLSKNLKASAKTIENSGKNIAINLVNKIPIIYSSQKMFCIAEKWKTDINENAKVHAFYNMFSEFNHNEICAYESSTHKVHVVIVSDIKDHQRIKKRIKIFKKLLNKYKTPVTHVEIKGESLLTRLMSSIWMGLFTAYYLAMEYDTDPTPVKIIEQLKKDL